MSINIARDIECISWVLQQWSLITIVVAWANWRARMMADKDFEATRAQSDSLKELQMDSATHAEQLAYTFWIEAGLNKTSDEALTLPLTIALTLILTITLTLRPSPPQNSLKSVSKIITSYQRIAKSIQTRMNLKPSIKKQ